MSLRSLLAHFHHRPNELPDIPLNRRDIWIAISLTATVLLLGSLQMVPGVCGVYHDDAIYVITAKALAQGEGYRLINLPNFPLQTKYPILYPALLAIIWKIWPSFPANLVAMQSLSLIMGAAAAALAYLYLVRFGYASRGVAFASTLIPSVTPVFLYFSTVTLAETTYMFISILALWAIDRQAQRPSKRPGIEILGGILLALPFLTRTIGLVIIPSGLLVLYLTRRRLRWIAAGAALAVLPWILWMVIGTQWNKDQVTEYYTNYLNFWGSTFGLESLVRIIFYNSFYLLMSIATIIIAFMDRLRDYRSIIFPLVIFIGSVSIIGLLKDFNRHRILNIYLLIYLCVVIIWPWPPFRFVVPILPFLICFLLKEVKSSADKFRIILNHQSVYVIFLSILLCINLMVTTQIINANRAMDYPCSAYCKEPVFWSSYKEIFKWIKDNTKKNDIIASGLDTMMYLYTDRMAFRPCPINPLSLFYRQDYLPLSVDNFVNLFKIYQPSYLIQTPMPGFSEEKPLADILDKIFHRYPGWLTAVFTAEDKRFIIFKVQRHLQPAGDS